MVVDAESFLQLVEKLRAMGAAQIEGYGFKAIFLTAPPAVAPQPAKPPVAGTRRSPRDVAKQLPDAELREQAYAKELGR